MGNTCYLFLALIFSISTFKLLQSLQIFESILLKYYSAGVTELYPILIPYRIIPCLNISPNYTLS